MIQKHWATMEQMKSFIDEDSKTVLNSVDYDGSVD